MIDLEKYEKIKPTNLMLLKLSWSIEWRVMVINAIAHILFYALINMEAYLAVLYKQLGLSMYFAVKGLPFISTTLRFFIDITPLLALATLYINIKKYKYQVVNNITFIFACSIALNVAIKLYILSLLSSELESELVLFYHRFASIYIETTEILILLYTYYFIMDYILIKKKFKTYQIRIIPTNGEFKKIFSIECAGFWILMNLIVAAILYALLEKGYNLWFLIAGAALLKLIITWLLTNRFYKDFHIAFLQVKYNKH